MSDYQTAIDEICVATRKLLVAMGSDDDDVGYAESDSKDLSSMGRRVSAMRTAYELWSEVTYRQKPDVATHRTPDQLKQAIMNALGGRYQVFGLEPSSDKKTE